ncbi:tyrosine-type recombinase/integrase [Bizionia saleffrena]|uniref:Tyrosine-type recombinase/integrase n=1 Tax=Bizionia saleffrena TaxID=291189 RepID=A0A8H2LGR5_9FLAO|nr:site-specific integrase [Bizionia saleffrena]TYB78118.1 tyrosine-type recombinase/integrase [Bizionia saleffrena]
MSKAIHSTSGTIKYRLKDGKAKGETSIILDYSFGRSNRIKFATGYKVSPKNWDKTNQRIRAVSTIKNRERVNSDLLDFSFQFTKAVSSLDEAQKQNKSVLKSLLIKIIRKVDDVEDKPITTFFEFADDYIRKRENQAKNINAIKLSPITVRSYKQTVSRLKDFEKKVKYNLDFGNIDLKFYYSFIEYLESNNYSVNTIGKHIKNLTTLLNRATEDGVNNNLKYKHREFKALSEDTVSIYLTESEIDALYRVDLSSTKDWELARDIFLIGYYTGQRVSDYNGITKNQIKTFNGQRVFEFKQQKTNKVVYVPIHSRVESIMNDRYNGLPPRILNDPDINEYIKEAGRKADINELVTVRKTEGGEKVVKDVPKHTLIVSHTARRSFCTNAYLSKMPTIDIMAISGHTTEREFYKYIKVTPQERAVKIADSAFFK